MNTLQVRRSLGEAEAAPDPSWRGLYKAGGVSGVLVGVLYIVATVLVFIMPQPPSSGGVATLQYIASNRSGYILELVLYVGPSVLAMVVFLALFLALKHLNKSYAALGAIIGIASEVIALALNSSPPSLNGGLVYLSDQYVAATTAAQRAAGATAAEGLIAVSNAVNGVGILTALGILILSLVMLKGLFPKSVAYLGIVTGALGIVSETLRLILGPGYIVYGVLLMIWFITIGWKLYRLGTSSSHSRVAQKLETGAVP